MTQDRSVVLAALLDDLANREKINPSLRTIDFVVFSGDLAYSGSADEYSVAENEFLNPIKDAVQVKVDRWFFVPGNHDVDQSELKFLPPMTKEMSSRDMPGVLVNEQLASPKFRNLILMPTQNYIDFCGRFLGPPAPTESYGYGYAWNFPLGEHKIALIGLNSAWLCGLNKAIVGGKEKVDDLAHLMLGEHQILKGLKGAAGATLRIGVLHHPFSWMGTVEARNRTESRLTRECHFILRGHEHESSFDVPKGTAGECAVVSAGAVYGDGGREYPIAYNFVQVDYDRQLATIHLRRYVEGQNKFGPDIGVSGWETPGYSSFALPKQGTSRQEKGCGKSAEEHVASSSKQTGREERSKVSISVAGDQWAAQNPAILESLGDVYSVQHANARFKSISSSFRVQANCLLKEGEPGFGDPDLVQTIKEFAPSGAPVYCLLVTMFAVPGQFLGQGDIKCNNLNGRPADYIPVPVRTTEVAGMRELLLFFNPVLQPGTGPYRLEVDWKVKDSMGPLLNEGKDELYLRPLRADGPVGRIDLVLQVPESYGSVGMKPSQRSRDVSRGGRPMTEEETTEYGAAPGFRSLGWTGRDLDPDAIFAVDILRS